MLFSYRVTIPFGLEGYHNWCTISNRLYAIRSELEQVQKQQRTLTSDCLKSQLFSLSCQLTHYAQLYKETHYHYVNAMDNMHHALKKGIKDLASLFEKLYRAPASYLYAIPVTVQEAPQPTYTNNETQHKQTCQHHEGAMLVAEYIVQEIKTNVKSEAAQAIRHHIGETEYQQSLEEWKRLPLWKRAIVPMSTLDLIAASSRWFMLVKTGAVWDHKPIIREKFRHVAVHRRVGIKANGELSTSHYHKYKQYDYFLDVWSNIHYGYVGLSVGFSEDYLLLGASLEQLRTTALGQSDPIDDVTAIKIGFELYKQFGQYAEDLTSKDLLWLLDRTSVSRFPEARFDHWCWNDKNPEKIRNNY